MNDAIRQMLQPYACKTEADYENALREIFQELILLGLWRSKFFEHAAFYGGTALRILYKLDRFSEDMDFSLIKPNANFDLSQYSKAVKKELSAWGFSVKMEPKNKTAVSVVESVFLKANTLKQILVIEAPEAITERMHNNKTTKIKIDVDLRPPLGFSTESHYLLQPFPFSVQTYSLPDLFAGKLHALLFRKWQKRIKGRDWYDFIWFIARGTPVNLYHLQQRMLQTGNWNKKDTLTRTILIDLLKKKSEALDILAARQDIAPFIKNKEAAAVWSNEFFTTITERIKTI